MTLNKCTYLYTLTNKNYLHENRSRKKKHKNYLITRYLHTIIRSHLVCNCFTVTLYSFFAIIHCNQYWTHILKGIIFFLLHCTHVTFIYLSSKMLFLLNKHSTCIVALNTGNIKDRSVTGWWTRMSLFVSLFAWSLCPFWHIRWCRGFCHRTESDLFLFLKIQLVQ